ncbi:MAG: O-acetyl-ADP-ribose deacetylase [Bacteroidales bacterium]|jgi:O-acetyl-ADP-ribose deacetylase (regulator of RNase III)
MIDRIELIQGDITTFNGDAIVNAANTSLLGGGGVDGAIHRAAGPGLLEVCRLLGGCPTGEAKITKGFKLQVKYIIHTVGPVCHGNNDREQKLLASCYRESLKLANLHNCKTIAFPNISTGIYHFPKRSAAAIAIREVRVFLKQNPLPEKVTFVCFDLENYEIYMELLKD